MLSLRQRQTCGRRSSTRTGAVNAMVAMRSMRWAALVATAVVASATRK